MARRAEPVEPPQSAQPTQPARPARRGRIAAFRLGLSVESRAAMLPFAKGYRIAARRWKTPFGEIDIVARRRRTLVFVEVKARDHADGTSVTVRGRRRIIAMRKPTSASTSCWSLPASFRGTSPMPSMPAVE